MKLPYRTLAGALLGLGLIVLFYGRMAQESRAIIEGQQQASRAARLKAQRARLNAQADSAGEATWRAGLLAALATRQAATSPRLQAQSGAAAKAPKTKTPTNAPAPGANSKQRPGPVAARPAPASQPPATPGGNAQAETSPAASPGWADWLRRQLRWLLPLLAALGGLLLAWMGRLVWRERQKVLVEPQRYDRDPPILRALLEAYAVEMGRLLPVPRQVKRFASKARLQNNLLQAAFKRSPVAPTPAFPAVTQEVLGFLLLLLLEEETVRESQADTPPVAEPPQSEHPGDSDEADFTEKTRALFAAWHKQAAHETAYQEFQARLQALQAQLQQAPTQATPYAQLPADLATPNGNQLLIELHRLNTGLLV